MRRLVDDMIAAHPDGEADLVSQLAAPLPLHVIWDMTGIPEQDKQHVFHRTNVILGSSDPELATDFSEFATASVDFAAYSTAIAEDRRTTPRDHLTTSLVQPEVDVERDRLVLHPARLGGNDTTRNAISHGCSP